MTHARFPLLSFRSLPTAQTRPTPPSPPSDPLSPTRAQVPSPTYAYAATSLIIRIQYTFCSGLFLCPMAVFWAGLMDSGGLKRARLAAGGISEETMVRIANEEGKRADAGTEATSLAITPKHISARRAAPDGDGRASQH